MDRNATTMYDVRFGSAMVNAYDHKGIVVVEFVRIVVVVAKLVEAA
jgi:hypothetical protein